MPAKNEDLHGNVPDECAAALLLIDVINDMEYPGGDAMLRQALPAARNIATLKRRAREAGIPAIYVNDNFGKWRSDFAATVRHCLDAGARGKPVVELLRPTPDDYFVLKPKHSAFYATPLDLLLRYLGATTLILTGIAGNSCVMFTAADAYLRDYNLFVPADCCASISPEDNRTALDQMHKSLDADVRPSADLDLRKLARRAAHG